MGKPSLLVVAGCNGSGKSSFSNALTPNQVEPFDYDKHFLLKYNSLQDSDIRSEMAHNLTFELFEEEINNAISSNTDFCYETNFNSSPLHWPNIFKKAGFEINLIYFCLESISQAKKRVAIRVENGGHHVPDEEIESRFKAGYLNVDKYFQKFDNVHLLNASFYNEAPKHIVSLSNNKNVKTNQFPDFLKGLIPNIYQHIK